MKGENRKKLEAVPADPTVLTDDLASSVRQQSGCNFGLALHAVTDPDTKIQNLARGQMYIALSDGERILRRESTTAGRGAYDRSRMTLKALELLRAALLGRTE
jgi:nicotinamide mononucleotide (NMN) deamidase PncC